MAPVAEKLHSQKANWYLPGSNVCPSLEMKHGATGHQHQSSVRGLCLMVGCWIVFLFIYFFDNYVENTNRGSDADVWMRGGLWWDAGWTARRLGCPTLWRMLLRGRLAERAHMFFWSGLALTFRLIITHKPASMFSLFFHFFSPSFNPDIKSFFCVFSLSLSFCLCTVYRQGH